jgi:CRISPR-associated endonuclease/helicase Cas3
MWKLAGGNKLRPRGQMSSFDELFQTCTGTAPYEFQRAFANAPVLPDLLEAPTGSGKTATALLGWLWRRKFGSAAQRAEAGRRLVYCLPMRTLVEQTERCARLWREKLGMADEQLGIHLLLGGAVDDSWEEHPDRDAIIIGTQDQLLSRALMRGYAMSRYKWPVHFALLHNDCTWVMDEVQLMGVGASTAAQLQAFREQRHAMGSAKTVWMTATLAEDRLRTVDVHRDFTRMPFSSSEPALQRRLLASKTLERARNRSGKDLTGLAKEIAAAHEPGTLTVVIVNRVARAQELKRLVAASLGDQPTALIHSRFRPVDRKRIQDAVLFSEFKGVLIATQAIEAGVDLSAKTLFTELAPWASLVQRFGRLNRAGEHLASRAIWIDLDTGAADSCLPYDAALLEGAREKLARLIDVGPASLAQVEREREEPALPVLRYKDLLELFDTEPDLAGHDIDVSRYIRATDDRDLQVAWRALGNAAPKDDAPDLHRDELCAVPVHELEKLTKGRGVWRYDSLRSRWVEAQRLFPGLTVVVDVSAGGYSPDRGFTRDKSDVPPSAEVEGAIPDADASDPLTYYASEYVSLRTHADDTAEAMEALLRQCNDVVDSTIAQGELVVAARWHDAGKVHLAFQEMLTKALPAEDPRRSAGPWAKSDGVYRARNPRRFFRHELSSALSWLAEGRSDLGAYLVAAHHGKVRLTLRARPGEEPPATAPKQRFAHGIHDGDELPEADVGGGVVVPAQVLSLACMELGGGGEEPPWADRTQRLLEQHGPFRLAYLEMLIRVADWRASARRQVPARPAGAGGRS